MTGNATPRAPNRWRSALLVALGAAVALAVPAVRADQTEELARLKQEAAQLRRSLDQLEAKIRALENEGNGRNVGATAVELDSNVASASRSLPTEPSSLAAMRHNWSQVQPGATEDAVQALLGKPERILRIDGNPVWYYLYPGVGRGSVFFTLAGKVSSTQPPVFGWFW